MAYKQLVIATGRLPGQWLNRLSEPIQVKCALDTGHVLIDGFLIACRSEAPQGPSWQGLRPRPPQSYSCSTSRRPTKRNTARADDCGDAVDQR